MVHVSYWGTLFAMITYAVSVSPSLLPRRWWWHAFVSGIATGLAYLVGWGLQTALVWAGGHLGVEVTAPTELVHSLRLGLFILVALWVVWSVVRHYADSRRAALLVDMKPVNTGEYLVGLVVTGLMFAVIYQINALLMALFNAVVALLERWLPNSVAFAISFAAVVAFALLVSTKVIFKAGLAIFARQAAALNTTSGDGFAQPPSPEYSGSPQSLSPWETIGGQGRKFLTLGPTASDIEAVTGKPAMQPIRVYAGMPKATSALEPLADLVVEELVRTGAFQREVIIINTATGSGWVDEWLVQPVEYLTGGNCATATMQYSYLFSAAMLVTSLDPCEEAGRVLFDRVWAQLKQIPEDQRPAVYVTGESLGAYGSQAAFEEITDMEGKVEGAVWVGSPNTSHLSRELTTERYPGSPEVAPVYNSGLNVRFVNDPSQLTADIFGRPFGEWDFPRAVFVQHASDPVVWFDFPLIWREPDWLRERVGGDVTPSMRYTPVVSFLQVLADLPVAGTAPAGHGHTYHAELVRVWYYVLGLDTVQPPYLKGRPAPFPVTPELLDDIADAIGVAMAPSPVS